MICFVSLCICIYLVMAAESVASWSQSLAWEGDQGCFEVCQGAEVGKCTNGSGGGGCGAGNCGHNVEQ